MSSSGYSQPPQGTYLIRLNLRENREEQQEWRKDEGKKSDCRHSACGNFSNCLAGCKNTNITKKEREKPVITLGSDSYPPYNYLNEDGIPTGIDVELATEAFRRMGYQVDVVQINWEKKKELVESGEIDCIMAVFPWKDALTITAGQDPT